MKCGTRRVENNCFVPTHQLCSGLFPRPIWQWAQLQSSFVGMSSRLSTRCYYIPKPAPTTWSGTEVVQHVLVRFAMAGISWRVR